MKRLAIAALLAASVGHAADVSTGSYLLNACKAVSERNPDDTIYAMYCIGYMAGMRNAATIARIGGSLCLPEKAQNGQLAKVVTKYLEEHPEQLHEDAGVLAFVAFEKAFPCPSK